MKQILLFVALLLGCMACSKEDKLKLEPVIKITGVNSLPQTKSGATGDITDSLAFITRYTWESSGFSTKDNIRVRRGFGLGIGEDGNEDGFWLLQRDTINNRLLLLDTDVLEYGIFLGQFVVDFTDILLHGRIYQGKRVHPKEAYSRLYDDILNPAKADTIGYIPNRVVLEAREKITAAFNAGNLEECQRLFNEVYVFLPTTGAKWRALKEAGIE